MDILASLPQFGNLLGTIIAFILALSVIVAIHEYGHYIVGRWCGIEAEVFSLGFGPVLWSRMDKRGTRWQFALLPLGGYVKFLGDADPASAGVDGEVVQQLSPERRRATMLGAPLWARAATVAAGPIFNFMLTIAIFTGVGLFQGQPQSPLTVGKLKNLPFEQGVMPGDEIVSIGGIALPSDPNAKFDRVFETLAVAAQTPYLVRRDGREVEVLGPFPMLPLIQQVAPQSAAYAIELKAGDLITAVDKQPIYAFSQLKELVEGAQGRALVLDVWRDGETMEFALAPKRVDEPQPDGSFVTNWRIGIVGGMFFEPARESVGVLAAFTNGVENTWEIMRGSVSGLWHMITGAISSCNMSGPIGIAKVAGHTMSQGTQSFVYFIGVLSAAVGLLNLFPIPVLDGGHLMFYAYEAVMRRPPSETALRVLMGAGLTLILSLMIFALFNDIFC